MKIAWQDHLVSDKEILIRKPTIKGTRIAVTHILDLLAKGWTEEKILESYPRLTKENLQAIFAYMYDCLKDGLIYTEGRKSA